MECKKSTVHFETPSESAASCGQKNYCWPSAVLADSRRRYNVLYLTSYFFLGVLSIKCSVFFHATFLHKGCTGGWKNEKKLTSFLPSVCVDEHALSTYPACTVPPTTARPFPSAARLPPGKKPCFFLFFFYSTYWFFYNVLRPTTTAATTTTTAAYAAFPRPTIHV